MRRTRKGVPWKLCVAFGAIAIALPCAIERARATVISWDLNVEFSTGFEPVGLAPWLRATVDDDDTPGSVTLTMSDLNLTGGGEHVNNWNFNLDPSLDPTLLSFSAPTVVLGAFGPITPTTGENFFQADGDGFFDIMFNFDTTNGVNSKFGSGDAVSFDITLAGITAGSFNFLSLVDGNPGIFFTAAQVGGIGDNDESGWIGFVPEPSTAALLIIGAIALLPIARRRIKR